MTVTPWDDYPVHQSSNWIAHVATSDRNFYDRYYFNVLDTQGRFMVVMGLGQYPNLGTTDAFVTVRVGEKQHVVRASKPLVDRSDISVGPLRIEVIEPLKRLRFVVHLCRWLSGEPQPLASQPVRWVDPQELGAYPFPAANAKIIAALLERLQSGERALAN